jgi:hypothetical protein
MSSESNSNLETAVSDPAIKARRWYYRLAVIFTFGFCFLLWIWSIGFAYCLDDNIPFVVAKILAAVIASAAPFSFWWFRKKHFAWPLLTIGGIFIGCLLAFSTMKPTHDRDWGLAQTILPFAVIDTDENGQPISVEVRNIRANRYGPVSPDHQSHYDDTYDLSKLDSIWFGVDRFTELEPLAHTFLSFGFKDGDHRANYLAFSVETRREKDEELYSPIRGLYKNYELIYVIADEQDVLSVRSDVRDHVVQLYPVRTSPERMKAMFVDMLERANGVRDKPEFYHTLTSNCTNNIVFHTNKILQRPISSWERGVVFPGYSDWLAHRRGIVDTDLTLEEARENFRIDQRVKAYDGNVDFSEFIRSGE